jgi:type II secretory pathway pseudopilin PulG
MPSGSPVFVSSTVTAFGATVASAKAAETTTEAQLSPADQKIQAETATPSPLQANDGGDSDSKRAKLLDPEPAYSHLCASGNILVVPQNSIFPARCVKCGNTPIEPWVRITFSWHHPGYYFLLVSPILYLIVALIVRKRIQLSIPLCKVHQSIRRKRLWIGGILLGGCIPLPTALGFYVDNDAAGVVAFFLGMGMFVAGLFFLAYAPPLKATHISSAGGEFKGACQEFLTSTNSVSTNQRRLQGTGMGPTWSIFAIAGIALFVFLIVAAIAIPNLLRARIAANESSAVASLRTINTAEIAYASAYTTVGYAPALSALGGTKCTPPDSTGACLIDTQLESGQKSGYRFEIRSRIHSETEGDKYQVVAYPQVLNQTGVRAFCSDETAIIKFDANGSPDDCLANGSPLQ